MSQTLNAAIAVIGIDIGKNSFHIVGHDERGAIVLRQKWSRGQVEARFANMPPCLIGMEACVGAHHLSRKLNSLGHDARLMPAKYVRPYSKGQKNDFRDAALQQKRADLIGDAGALADQPLSHAVQRLQVELIRGLCRHPLHRRPLHRLGDRLRVAEVVLLSLRIGPDVLRRHQPGIVAKAIELATEMMRADTGLHAD